MDLPNYSQQLLQQLHMLCTEQQFCDCSILVGTMHFRAHKLVLAAASVLFRSVLDDTDTVSIDASVVAPDEFALLLEMIYTGKLPPGKHNFTNIISVADSLQMFDVAVSCKTLLGDLLSCSSQDQVPRDISVQAGDASSNSIAISNSSHAAELSDKVMLHFEHVSPGLAELVDPTRQSNRSASACQEALDKETQLSNSHSQDPKALPPLCPGGQSVCKEGEATTRLEEKDLVQGGSEEVNPTAALLQESREEILQDVTKLGSTQGLLDTAEDEVFLSGAEKQALLDSCKDSSTREAVENLLKKVVVKEEEKILSTETLVKLVGALSAPIPGLGLLLDHWVAAAVGSDGTARRNLEAYGKSLLRHHQDSLARYVAGAQQWQQALLSLQHLLPGKRQLMEEIVAGAVESGVFSALASAALEEQVLPVADVWQVLQALQETDLPLKQFLAEIQQEPDTALFFQTVGSSDSIATEILLRHRKLISEALHHGAGWEEAELPPPAEAGLAELAKPAEEAALDAVPGRQLVSACLQEVLPVTSWRAVLSSAQSKQPLPATQICQLLCCIQESFPGLQAVMQELQQAGLLTAVTGGKSSVWKWKVNSMSQIEAVGKVEQKQGLSQELPKKSLSCKACRKSFRFYCRLKVHEKRCRVASQKLVQCKECGERRASKVELEKHQVEAHGKASAATLQKKPKKPRLPVACDICGREFAHTSGMQYHKLTEHFDEKPFSCKECGAKFAANSTLKNHQRLHTGDQPFVCKHCPMTFSQASALAYHTKKKHAKGKMYACQYCAAVFAQSIELSRHVRTHTGDKPYVCRECGKGFRQANGLSIHLRTFHNIDDPYDCKKCQMSFPTLQEHQKHIHAAHSREYHPCPTCGKVFSAPSLLERHVVVHVGGKPFSCQICNKAYQQLSGLWYHNRTHHPDIFAAQSHRSSKFFSLQCSSCNKTFASMAARRRHAREEHADMTLHECEKCRGLFPTLALLQAHEKSQHSGRQPLLCPHCSASFHLQGALQHHLATKHATHLERSFGCGLCGEVFSEQEQLAEHCGAEHPKMIQTPEQVISMAEPELAGSQVFLTSSDLQGTKVEQSW
ncbi:zinc finger and BTB domain-containing protein 40 isoform X2 [Rhineura floridana]|nr:zinc finger and BTB domain-containing protein 40 isoform X2 [Rhineura floridana]XP_061456736.1 zinc finger and BTB domain-containing protein 40 isoform X2 [Rhineura floridana]XP_061456737.1 zinc finger and BTB domain-containing protein 40 isoform X2 [Rhineura floridana]